MKKIKIPLTCLLAVVVVMYFFAERNLRNEFSPKRDLPFGVKPELDKGWDKLIFKRAKEVASKQKTENRKQKTEKIPALPVGLKKDDFIKNWLICGPFPNPGGRSKNINSKKHSTDSKGWMYGVKCSGWNRDFFKAIGGEMSLLPDKGMKVSFWKKRYKWRPLKSKNARIDFTKVFSKSEHVIAYAACYVYSNEEKGYLIKLGSDDGYKLWANHKLTALLHVHRGSKPDQNSHQVLLHKGWNSILIKVCQDIGGFNFYLRLTDLEGYSVKLPVRLNP